MEKKKSHFKGEVEESKRKDSGLHVNDGVDKPPQVNPNLKFKRERKLLTAKQYADGILEGNRTLLSQSITLIESSLPERKQLAQDIINLCVPHAGNSVRIGITGVPGVGKSSFIESLGHSLVQSGRKLAVLAIDPSSERSKGSILGDKTRMNLLSSDENAFIRPSPSAGSLGGVARKTRESIILCEAAGFDTIFVETVGVGQSEIAVHSMVDFFLLLMLAGAGDELQGIKRGIMEMADAIAINKADGDNLQRAELAKAEYKSALHLFPPTESGWVPKVLTCSALTKTGIQEIWDTVQEYVGKTRGNGFFEARRKEQARYWMYETINESLKADFYSSEGMKTQIKAMEAQVLSDKKSSFSAAHKLLNQYYSKHNQK
ncbi:MAG: methylmalonyl Co-A mutase-associated GTPase MeaB [Bacteroidales bacterium]|jgi:LAO/AO transport system kinase|nr:methylmalonyl Co-A mutase-associated GTPase MeaB [Bacteroidales bacterium]